MALTPSFSTGGMPRPSTKSVGTTVSSLLKTKMPSLRAAGASKGVSLKGITMPKPISSKGMGKISVKAPKATKTSIKSPSSLSSTLKSIISASKKTPPMGMSSAIGAPAQTPSPAFFGRPNAGPGGIGLGM